MMLFLGGTCCMQVERKLANGRLGSSRDERAESRRACLDRAKVARELEPRLETDIA